MEIQKAFHLVLAKKLAVPDFEAWVYATSELEKVLDSDDYFELISLNYKDRVALHNLKKLLDKYIDCGQVYTEELKQILQKIINYANADEVLTALVDSYDWWSDGYSFLEDLGFTYGMVAGRDFVWEESAVWENIPALQKQKYIKQFYPAVEQEAKRILNWLEAGTIQLRPRLSDYEVEYIDKRNAAERKSLPVENITNWYVPTAAVATYSHPATLYTLSDSGVLTLKTDKPGRKSWWMFWK
ncbi:hypothetical protein [Hymenobacter defluvii]|uniref:Uncharacterized protein n=1 Tax=Hymenobacter defluvii TaxID=2054411 RepID=A0ABS3TFY1_9BACT|nr:hypothetical protein [Hymenobacter defluvii]MBO3272552.1 hypothetical protein [Hymenobacter defluvii]